MRPKLRKVFILIAFLGFGLAINPVFADPVVTPILGSVFADSRVGSNMQSNTDQLPNAINPLMASAFATDGTTTIESTASATWMTPNRGSATLNHIRENGLNSTPRFHGNSSFVYQFSIAEAAELVVDYDFTGITTSPANLGQFRWLGMQGYSVSVDNGSPDQFSFSLAAANDPNIASPINFNGQLIYSLDPGSHVLGLGLLGSGFGDSVGDHSMTGGIDFHIRSAVPEPGSMALLIGMAGVVVVRRKRQ